ncbi:hypothetical protein A4H97_30065 [Niastella yeongjuensis]|uniref:Uncharacterized protein n=1 Tax=Niastella yeongjuensis TaxID=354355 RepID=A0A1V9EPR9_9BACT|nr:hypothetical protein [Niastella yeongjuensis]OQP48081.1 hypothetical protein A4H97_30065 [Niastella yeongjuensis]SEO25987.1 hypothetical protein SAMN05660816_02414 [Niastella yeongjuensis]
MGASLDLCGVNAKKIVEGYPGYFKNSQEISLEEFIRLYDETLWERKYDSIDRGIEFIFGNAIRRYCSVIWEMTDYCFSSFDWLNDEREVEQHELNYKLTKDQVIDLMDWYIALSYVFSDDEYVLAKIKEPKYLEQAKRMIEYFEAIYKDRENYFKVIGYDFVALKEEVVNAHYDFYFYTYSC